MGTSPFRWIFLATLVVCLLGTLAPGDGPGTKAPDHWSFNSPQSPSLPKLRDPTWPRNPVDHFILHRLESAGLKPRPQADPNTLIRRVTLDLTGLPPTPQEADAFAEDSSPGAYEKVVDRLLESDAYGEHWASMWLDLARYADTQGYEKDNHRDIWRYRDWVIAAFNADMPFDQFTIEQIAGDLLPSATTEQKLATAFHRNTMTNTEGGTDDEEFRVAAVKDRVDTTMQIWMGLTMGCAKCHTHKYDPISITEYYQFYSYFNQTQDRDAGNDHPRLPTPTLQQQAEVARLNVSVTEQRTALSKAIAASPRARRAWEAKIAAGARWIPLIPTDATSGHGSTLRILADGSVLASGKTPERDVYTLTAPLPPGPITALRIDAMTDASLPRRGPGRNPRDPNFVINELVAELLPAGEEGQTRRLDLTDARADFSQKNWPAAHAIDGNPKTGWAVSPRFGQAHAAAYRLKEPLVAAASKRQLRVTLRQLYGQQLLLGRVRISVASADPKLLDVIPGRSLREVVAIPEARRTPEQRKLLQDGFAAVHPPLAELRKKLDATEKRLAEVRRSKAPTTPVMAELPPNQRRTTRIQNRGNFLDPGATVQAALPAAFGPMPEDFSNDRLGVARWLVHRDNPLTARVHANRLWARLFGIGLVETEGDFGTQGTPPSHPALLDWLAVQFTVEQKWSQKQLLKTLVMSASYRQASDTNAEGLNADPRNRLLWRGPRFRLSAETVRDQALAAGGLLAHKLYGPSVMPPQPDGIWSAVYNSSKWRTPDSPDRFRRGLYTYWRRTSPYPSMLNFDAGSREVCLIRRIRTNTPLQALVLMNDPVYVEAAAALARRAVQTPGTFQDQATRLFRSILVRPPHDREIQRLAKTHKAAHAHFKGNPDAAKALMSVARANTTEQPVETAAWTMVANVVLNLDETVTKP
ncbi:MAG: DUF1549 and DUF1553 domain-containing protein [Phycisphaerae bacterium]|nr:DUF1549 and DUF1553 domain-containing protein [Phycisphaerae bacterium]